MIVPADEHHRTAAAAIGFFRRQAAELFLDKCDGGLIKVEGVTVNALWNRNKIADSDTDYRSRVLLIAGDPKIVNKEYIDVFLSSKIVYGLDMVIDHGVVSGFEGTISRLEYRFASWYGQSNLAHKALMAEHDKDSLLVQYGEDPCC